jgi:hypothetical protein
MQITALEHKTSAEFQRKCGILPKIETVPSSVYLKAYLTLKLILSKTLIKTRDENLKSSTPPAAAAASSTRQCQDRQQHPSYFQLNL